MGSKKAKTALDEIIAARNAKQSQKSVKQLYLEASGALNPKVSNFEGVHKRDRIDFSHIPGRSRAPENERSIKKREEAAARDAERMDRARIDWTETNEFGHIVMSASVRCLELSTVPDYGGESKSGPTYPRGIVIEGLTLGVDNVAQANSTTFDLLKPKRRADYNPDESKRYALAPGAHKVKEFELVEPLEDVVSANPQTGRIEKSHLHLNSVALPDDDVFKIGRAVMMSEGVELVDLYGNFIGESPAAFLADGLNQALEAGGIPRLKSISLSGTMPGPALYTSLQDTLGLSKTLTSLALTNLFMPMTDNDGAVLCKGLAKSRALTSLNLSGNLLGKMTCWELKLAIMKNRTLRTLNLECNQVQDDACFHIAGALMKNAENRMESLYLGWNMIDHVGFGAIIDATSREHSRLKLVNLRNNKISRCSSGNVIRGLSSGTSLTSLCLANNRIADMSEMGIGLYMNASLIDLDMSHNYLADDAFGWFAEWGKDKEATERNRLRSLNLAGNKLGDLAAQNMCKGLVRRKLNRCISHIVLDDNLIDPILIKAVTALTNHLKPFLIVKREAKALLAEKLLKDKKYWKERDWEALQHKRKLKMDEAVRLLNNRTEDEIELDALVNQPAVARIPVVNKLVVLGSQVLTGTKPVWYLQEEIINHQKGKADADIKLRKALVKGLKKE